MATAYRWSALKGAVLEYMSDLDERSCVIYFSISPESPNPGFDSIVI